MAFLHYADEIIEATKLCVKYNMISKEEAVKGISNVIERYGKMKREIEIALNNLLDFKRRLENGEI